MPAAARIYFDKEVGELNLGEAAMFAGTIRAPSQLNPLTNPEAARRRRNSYSRRWLRLARSRPLRHRLRA